MLPDSGERYISAPFFAPLGARAAPAERAACPAHQASIAGHGP